MYIVILAVAVVVTAGDLVRRFLYELQGPITWDTTIYLAVGRGILNGLLPYRDLFETKPPGIFLLGGLSLWLHGDAAIAAVAQAIAIALIPFCMAWAAWHLARPHDARVQILVLFAAFLMGGTLALYTAERAGEFQVESFGVAFSALYIAAIASHHFRAHWWTMAIASFSLLGAIGMKEPFLLSTFAAALILFADAPYLLLRLYLLPLAMAAVVGGGVMGVLGYLGPYLSIYIPYMLEKHISIVGPWWERGWAWGRLADDFYAYAPLLSGAIAVAIVLFLVQLFHSWRRAHISIPCFLLAAYLTVLVVGLEGHYFNHHFAFAVPSYMALFLAVVSRKCQWEWRWLQNHIAIVTPMATLAVLLALAQPDIPYEARLIGIRDGGRAAKEAATHIDRVLGACSIPSYMFLGTNGPQPYAYTKHSPLGPSFVQYAYISTLQFPLFRTTFIHNLQNAQLVVAGRYELLDLQPFVEAYLRDHFSMEPWPCASGESYAGPYRLYYRNGSAREW